MLKRTLTAVTGVIAAAIIHTAAAAGVVPGMLFAQAGPSNNEAMMMLLDQVQALRTELQTLRGMVEEQGYDLRRLQQDSLDRYTDLDSRISAIYQDSEVDLSTGGVPQTAATAGTVDSDLDAGAVRPPADLLPGQSGTVPPVPSDSEPDSLLNNDVAGISQSPSQANTGLATSNATSSGNLSNNGAQNSSQAISPVPTGMMTEQQLYEFALDALLQQGDYQTSIAGFDQYLSEYPSGNFVTNAYYWKGQAYVNLSMFEEARDAFETIVNDHPNGRKVEDAMYSLGTVYDQLGDTARARQTLQEVRNRFPNTSAANLSDIYLRTLN